LEIITFHATPVTAVRDFSLVVTVSDDSKSSAALVFPTISSFHLSNGDAQWPLRPGCTYVLILLAAAEPGVNPTFDVTFSFDGTVACQQTYGRIGSGPVHQWIVTV
jgi:hypothetical protein